MADGDIDPALLRDLSDFAWLRVAGMAVEWRPL